MTVWYSTENVAYNIDRALSIAREDKEIIFRYSDFLRQIAKFDTEEMAIEAMSTIKTGLGFKPSGRLTPSEGES